MTMSDTPDKDDGAGSAQNARRTSDQAVKPAKTGRRRRRVVVVSLASVLALAIAAAVSIYAFVNHTVSSVPRVHVSNLSSAGSGQTFLIAGAPYEPTGTAIQGVPPQYTKLFMLLHINPNGRAGGVVTIPGDVLVQVPGVGTEPLWIAFKTGGPSLLVSTVSQLTGIPINHYAEINLSHLTSLIDVVGGVNVTIPVASTSYGHLFSSGVNHLTGITATYYDLDPSISDQVRILRQENLLRAVLTKIADDHLLTNPVTTIRLLNAITGTLTVDSNMTNSDIESLARKLGSLGSLGAATFLVTPTQTVNGKLVPNAAVADQLWAAVKKNSIAKFATAFPATVTPEIVP
jgi:LCP family protein required for cell wall assembly